MELSDLLNVAKEIVLLAPQTQGQILALEDIAIVVQARKQILHIGLLRMNKLLEYGVHTLVALITQLDFSLILSKELRKQKLDLVQLYIYVALTPLWADRRNEIY